MHRFLVQNTIEQKMYTLLKSMDVKPNVAKGSDELSLTIGDITSFFVQHMEPIVQEGAHSPEPEPEPAVPNNPVLAIERAEPRPSYAGLFRQNEDTSFSLDFNQPSCSHMGQGHSSQCHSGEGQSYQGHFGGQGQSKDDDLGLHDIGASGDDSDTVEQH